MLHSIQLCDSPAAPASIRADEETPPKPGGAAEEESGSGGAGASATSTAKGEKKSKKRKRESKHPGYNSLMRDLLQPSKTEAQVQEDHQAKLNASLGGGAFSKLDRI
jgi:hypothetical protein